MSDFHRVRNIRAVVHFDSDDSFSAWQGALAKVSAQFQQEQARLPRLWQSIGNLRKPSHLLQQFHYSHFGGHKSILMRLIAVNVPRY
jgi:hypothetical protein